MSLALLNNCTRPNEPALATRAAFEAFRVGCLQSLPDFSDAAIRFREIGFTGANGRLRDTDRPWEAIVEVSPRRCSVSFPDHRRAIRPAADDLHALRDTFAAAGYSLKMRWGGGGYLPLNISGQDYHVELLPIRAAESKSGADRLLLSIGAPRVIVDFKL